MLERPVRWRDGGPSDDTLRGGSEASATVLRRLRRAMPDLRRCYEQELQQDPRIRGRLTLDITIAADGRVERVTARGIAQSPAIGQCVAAAVAGITFEGEDVGPVTYSFPIVFAPGG